MWVQEDPRAGTQVSLSAETPGLPRTGQRAERRHPVGVTPRRGVPDSTALSPPPPPPQQKPVTGFRGRLALRL